MGNSAIYAHQVKDKKERENQPDIMCTHITDETRYFSHSGNLILP